MNTRKKLIISTILNSIIIIGTIYAFIWVCGRPNESELKPGFPGSLRYFTVLSNLFCFGVSVAKLIENVLLLKNQKSIENFCTFLFRYVSTTAVMLTFIVVAIFLGPADIIAGGNFHYFGFFTNGNFFMHFLTPVISFVSFIYFENEVNLKKNHILFSMIPTIIYSILYVICVVVVKCWPDFYGFTFGGKMYLAPVSCACIYGTTYLIGYIEYKLKISKMD